MPSPRFRYHPDPIATGAATESDDQCSVCGALSKYRYVGPIYGQQADTLCLTCIQSGRAAQSLGVADMPAMFTDSWGAPDEVPISVIDEVTQRTPGFHSWQQPHWLYHCADAAAFLGSAGHAELVDYPDALDMLRADYRRLGWSESETETFLTRLARTGEPTAYLFACLHCPTHLAFWDLG